MSGPAAPHPPAADGTKRWLRRLFFGPSAGEARKIGSIGVHVSRGVTTHGLAVNVDNDLQPFEWIVPCGIGGARMTSVNRELGCAQDLAAFADTVVARFCSVFDRVPVPADLARLAGGSAAKATDRLPVR